MIGQFCAVSTGHNHSAHSPDDSDEMKGGLMDYVCPECGAQPYHLVFRVDARSHRVTALITCDVCNVRAHLPKDGRALEESHALEMVTGQRSGTTQS